MVKDRNDYLELLKTQFPDISEDDLKIILSVGDEELFRFSECSLVVINDQKSCGISVLDMPVRKEKDNTHIFNEFKMYVFKKLHCLFKYLNIEYDLDHVYINIPASDYLSYVAGITNEIYKVKAYRHKILAELKKGLNDYTLMIDLNGKYRNKHLAFHMHRVNLNNHVLVDMPAEKPITYFFNNNINYKALYGRDKKHVFERN